MRVVYDGPFPAVDVPDLGCVVERGVPIDVTDEFGSQLVDQGPWSRQLTAEEAEAERVAAEQRSAAAEAAEEERLAAEKAAAEKTNAEPDAADPPVVDAAAKPKPAAKPARPSKENS